MQMPGRVFSSGSYRYGFNGKENDNDVKGTGNQQDYGERVYDTRLGRFLSTDPLTKSYPMLTPYQYASNSPIWMIDLDGLEGVKFSDFWNGKAHLLQFLSDPDIKGTAFETTQSFNRNYNPVFKVNNYALKLRTGSDYDGNPIDSRGKTGVIADFGVEALMWVTLIKLQAPKANQPVEVQLTQQAKALGNATPKPTQVSSIGSTGTVGENFLKTLGGVPQKYFPTTVGKGGRYIDQFVNGVANESKVGYTTLTKDIQMQIAKDVELLGSKESGVKEVVWNFFRSPVTGKAGASKPLQKALEKAGIKTKIIELE